MHGRCHLFGYVHSSTVVRHPARGSAAANDMNSLAVDVPVCAQPSSFSVVYSAATFHTSRGDCLDIC